MVRTKEQFRAKLDEVRNTLESTGDTAGINVSVGDGRLKFDFDLPYSSMPKLQGKKWLHSEYAP